MYKLLLSLRYLRSRYIALASIISVMLGVATMIVVNSVMSGFQNEMYNRLHGILSDIVVEAQSSDGLEDPDIVEAEIRELLGDELLGVTTTVHIPAMLGINFRGQWITKQVNLIGIDEDSYADVGDFSKYLLHPGNREDISFDLRKGGYDARLGDAGWDHRRMRVAIEREHQRLQEQAQQARQNITDNLAANRAGDQHAGSQHDSNQDVGTPGNLEDASQGIPDLVAGTEQPIEPSDSIEQPAGTDLESIDFETPADDAFAEFAEEASDEFDADKETWTGIVLGISLSNIKHRAKDGTVVDFFTCKPGDDIVATFATAGKKPQAVSANFTVVDFYESKMSEYDNGFAFIPIKELQELRGMIDPVTGSSAVSSLQIKLAAGADLNAARDKLRERFPVELFPYRIQTWKELQGPLLAAVQMETTILNILLFLIIAVAGFGILATFFMIVVEKTRDIGILKSLGASSGGVMSIFLSYGFSLGCVGSGVGMVLGLLFVKHINRIAGWLETITGREVFDPTVYYFQEIPTIINLYTVAWIACGAMLIAVFASVLPAIRAARMHPVEALRYE